MLVQKYYIQEENLIHPLRDEVDGEEVARVVALVVALVVGVFPPVAPSKERFPRGETNK